MCIVLFDWQVLSSQSVTCPSEKEDLLCQCLPVSGCSAAAFLPSQPARLATVHCKNNSHLNTHHNKVLSVFDIIIKKTRLKTEIQGKVSN